MYLCVGVAIPKGNQRGLRLEICNELETRNEYFNIIFHVTMTRIVQIDRYCKVRIHIS